MKKATFPAVISTAIVCFLFWLLITGQLALLLEGEPSWQVLVAGALVSLGVGLFAGKYFIHERSFYLWHPARLFTGLFYCICVFPWELLKANWDVAKRALSPKLPINPGIVKVPVDLQSEYGQAALANSITLPPGTITMEVTEETTEEGAQDYFYIHWIDVATADEKEAGDAIKGRMEKWLRRIWK